MSGVGGPVPGGSYGTFGTITADAAAVRRQLDTLNRQASTGRQSETYAGLGGGARVSLDLRPAITANDAWTRAIDAAKGPLDLAQTALDEINRIATELQSDLARLNTLDPGAIASVAAKAQDSLKEVAGLLNTKSGDRYVFAGQDSANPPIPAPDDILASGFYTQIAVAVGGLAVNGAAATAASTLATAASTAAGTTPFGATLEALAAGPAAERRPTVEIGERQRRPVGILANQNADAASTGTGTTGSYMRDILRALATVGALTTADAAASGFQDFVQDTRTSLRAALSTQAADAGVLGDRQTALSRTRDVLADAATALKRQASDAEDVDMTETLSRLSLTQTRLQSSYQLIAAFRDLTLSRFLR